MDRGGVPAEGGPFLGEVMSNVDPTRSGRLKVYIETFADGQKDDDTKWTTVDYLPSFYGSTPKAGTDTGTGTYPGNRNSYGMWFTPPDVGVTVMCVFVNGDRDQGYYIGVVPDQGVTHMIPAIGAASNFEAGNQSQKTYLQQATQAPVTEINDNDPTITNSPRFFEAPKPVQSVLTAALLQQGLISDNFRGPIASSAQRESPSLVYGISTPGRPIFQGGIKLEDFTKRVAAGTVNPADAEVIGRLGGHTLVMDDGAVNGSDQLFRLRTSKGHQITMSDSGDFFYMIHANGQTWVEFGKEGTVDVYSTNSVNIHTEGDINLHAGQDINMYAGRDIKAKSKLGNITLESENNITTIATKDIITYAKGNISVKADGTLTVQSKSGSWNGGSALTFTASGIDLNGPAAPTITAPKPLIETAMDNVTFKNNIGWTVDPGTLKSIVTRAPTHEPYPYHNKGVSVK
jgi:hypothetical protein